MSVPGSGPQALPACDAHIHVLEAGFAPRGDWEGQTVPGGFGLDDYLRARRPFGTQRVVIVQSKVYGTDNGCLADALDRLGGAGRGIAVVDSGIPDSELRALDKAGVRGLRFSLWNAADSVVDVDMLEPLARRVADLGWHIQVHLMGEQIAGYADRLDRLPCPLVIDHMARLPLTGSMTGPAFDALQRLLDNGRTWVKLSGAYLNATDPETANRTGDYPEAARVARTLVADAPNRLVWGSDWPHLTELGRPPDDAALAAALRTWVPDLAVRDRILRQNPAELYGWDDAVQG
ncbi:amidohydrolase family protein [Gordonia sp. DT219]|uniref:amidohydrolase family protein n=1 Tax=Gordonia sp. DT219 TaxID=3416658 RepID=UPI003CEA391D